MGRKNNLTSILNQYRSIANSNAQNDKVKKHASMYLQANKNRTLKIKADKMLTSKIMGALLNGSWQIFRKGLNNKKKKNNWITVDNLLIDFINEAILEIFEKELPTLIDHPNPVGKIVEIAKNKAIDYLKVHVYRQHNAEQGDYSILMERSDIQVN